MLNAITFDSVERTLRCQGDWRLTAIPGLQHTFSLLHLPSLQSIKINGSGIRHLDSAGAWLLNQFKTKLQTKGYNVEFEAFSEPHTKLLTIVQHQADKKLNPRYLPTWLTRFGKSVCGLFVEFHRYLTFIGRLTLETKTLLIHPGEMRWRELAGTIFKTGYQALPIIGLLSFMIGIVIAYQMGVQLRNYGANIFIVNLLGLSVLREFGPLITAIMVAGRTGSAYTAQLGLMKINQEVDALDTMGLTPGKLLILPRILGLMISLPLLTMWANAFGIMGGMVMANNLLGISWYDFLIRFQHEIPLRALIIGLGKTPVFAFIIATIGCFKGMSVAGNADSLGLNTTRSVVLSIFFIIVVDAIFSVLFSRLGL